MKKFLMVLIFSLISVFSLVGCAEKNEKGQRVYRVYDDVTLVRVTQSDYYDILVHEETKVMYIRYHNGHQAGISVMIDEDGKPLLYKNN